MGSTFTLGRLAGIPVGVHYTWLFAFLLIAWSLATGFFPTVYPNWAPPTYWVVGLVCAVALFVSVLVHELSHSLVALTRGLHVHGIVLFIFGGVSHIEEDAELPRDEFLVAIVGPLASFLLAGGFWLAVIASASTPVPVRATFAYLATINVFLGAFNMIPGFPLDGGRVLRSGIWALTHDFERATRSASYVGQAVAFGLAMLGAVQLFSGNILAGGWTLVIAWFLNDAAVDSRYRLALSDRLENIQVAEVMDHHPTAVRPGISIHELVSTSFWKTGGRAVPVLEDGRLVGIVSVTDVKGLPHEAWDATRVRDVMTPPPLTTIDADAEVRHAVGALVEGPLHQLPVVHDGKLVGMLTRSHLLETLDGRLPLDSPAPERNAAKRAA
jgi:Zn-dependent protease/CBS domain-containing protein